MAKEQLPPAEQPESAEEPKRRAADKVRGKLETLGWFIKTVGLGAALAVFICFMLYQIFTGRVIISMPIGQESGASGVAIPALGRARAEEMFRELNATHAEQLRVQQQSLEISRLALETLRQQEKTAQRQTAVMNEISCRLYRLDVEQIKCLKRALRQRSNGQSE